LTLETAALASARAARCGHDRAGAPGRYGGEMFWSAMGARSRRGSRDVVLDILGIDALWSGRQEVVRFHPTARRTGAVLKLSREKAEYEIASIGTTGGVAIAP